MSIAALDIDVNKGTPVDLESYQQVRERNVASAPAPANSRITIEVLRSLDAALPVWRGFERMAVGTLYQNSLWCQAWAETVGQQLDIKPRIVVARNSLGTLQFILPLQVRKRQGVRVLEWLGSPHHNYGHGLFDPGFMPAAAPWFDDNWDRILDETGGFDAIALTEMPERLAGIEHPMLGLANLRAANLSFGLRLEVDFEQLHARKKSAERRRAARKHASALAELGTVSFGLPQGKSELHALIDVMFGHQQSRLAELGVHRVFGPAERLFVHRLAEMQDEDNPILAPYRLTCDGNVLAVMLGGLHGNCYWALISSLAPGPLRKHSPGDLALLGTIEACCRRGLTMIDFSAGDSSYKRAWADDIVAMRVLLRGRNLIGIMWAGVMTLRLLLKRQIKESPVLLGLSLSLRRRLFAKRA